MSARCRAIKASGERCQTAFGLSDDGFCFVHDPERAEERKASRRAGAAARNGKENAKDLDAPPPPTTLNALLEWEAWLLSESGAGRVSTSRANSLTKLLTEIRQALTMKQTEELEERIAALEALRGPRAAS